MLSKQLTSQRQRIGPYLLFSIIVPDSKNFLNESTWYSRKVNRCPFTPDSTASKPDPESSSLLEYI